MMSASWASDGPPEELRHVIDPLEAWATDVVRTRGLAQRVRVRPDELTVLLDASPALVDIAVEADYLGDPGVPADHLRFLVAHEIAHAQRRRDGATLVGKEAEHACDCIARELVGVEVAAAAIDGYRRWREARGLIGSDEGSASHPSADERISYVRRHCV